MKQWELLQLNPSTSAKQLSPESCCNKASGNTSDKYVRLEQIFQHSALNKHNLV